MGVAKLAALLDTARRSLAYFDQQLDTLQSERGWGVWQSSVTVLRQHVLATLTVKVTVEMNSKAIDL